MLQSGIEALLAQKMGLEADTIGSQKIAKVAESRRLSSGLPDLQSYLKRLQTSPQELEELIEDLVIPETWFFRDRKPFELVSDYAISQWLSKSNHTTLRVLSAPCSTGEEPYSIAMALIDAGLSPEKFRIDAIDISKKAILKAQRGVYHKNSFRGGDIPQKERYFKETPEGFEIAAKVRQTVNFTPGNLVEPSFLNGRRYDIIFCRNVLIYLSDSASSEVMAAFDRALMPNGLLFVGASETSKVPNQGFESVRQPFTFAYRKVERESELPSFFGSKPSIITQTELILSNPDGKEGKAQKQSVEKIQETVAWKEKLTEKREGLLPKIETGKSSAVRGKEPPKPELKSKNGNFQFTTSEGRSHLPNLQTARQLADAGKLKEAATIGKSYLAQHPTSAQAYLLLGEVYQASGSDREAEQYFQKALYLEPNCYEALTHLALIKQNQGDLSGVTVIKQRIKRLENKG